MARFCDLPENLIVEIMSWLPPESLLRFKCVRKSWYALINTLFKSHWFVAKHLKNSESSLFLFNKRIQIIAEPRRFKTSNSYMNKADDGDGQIDFDVKKFPLSQSVSGGGPPCDGILFLHHSFTGKILLCNPTIREFRILQNSSFASDFRSQRIAGFGYDPVANVYKVVRVVHLHGKNGGPPFGAEVCTLSTDHGDSWREIGMKIEINGFCDSASQVHHKGVCYWSPRFASSKKYLISFDLHNEEFHTIPLPEDYEPGEDEYGPSVQLYGPPQDMPTIAKIYTRWRLALWNGSVALLKSVTAVYPCDFTARPIKMWVMDESSASVSRKASASCWIRYPSLFPQENVLYQPVAFWTHDEIILYHLGNLTLYNLCTQKTRIVHLNSLTWDDAISSLGPFVYQKSLVSIGGTRWNVDSS